MFTTADLSYMREQANLLMPDTGTILTETRSSDGIGGFASTWEQPLSRLAGWTISEA
jgi:hypothetical protein